MSIFRFFKRPLKRRKTEPHMAQQPAPLSRPELAPAPKQAVGETVNPWAKPKLDIRRYFHSEPHFQCYTSWFAHWGGWISAGHCLTEAQDHLPSFAAGQSFTSWPDGLDAAIVGCTLPHTRPEPPRLGQDIILQGYPAGSRHIEQRTGRVYFERSPGQWIAHIFEPDEPVVTGMSGGPVLDAKTREPIGITITRNSPADLNNDRDPDESADFIALSTIWDVMSAQKAKTRNA